LQTGDGRHYISNQNIGDWQIINGVLGFSGQYSQTGIDRRMLSGVVCTAAATYNSPSITAALAQQRGISRLTVAQSKQSRSRPAAATAMPRCMRRLPSPLR
jgi:hypothetical protein